MALLQAEELLSLAFNQPEVVCLGIDTFRMNFIVRRFERLCLLRRFEVQIRLVSGFELNLDRQWSTLFPQYGVVEQPGYISLSIFLTGF